MNTWKSMAYGVIVTVTAVLFGCGGGGGDSDTPPSVLLSGQVQAPSGQIALLRKPTLLDSIARLFIPAAQAMISGLLPVEDGTQVDLVRINDAGTIDAIIASTTTTGGRYTFNLTASNVEFSSDLMVLVPGLGVQMRAFVTTETIDINPVTEAVSRVVFEQIASTPGSLLENFTVAEIHTLYSSVDLLTSLSGSTTLADVDSTVTAVINLVMQDNGIINFLASAASPGQTETGPGDVANLFPLDLGDTWNFLVGASDQNSDYFNETAVTGTKLIDGLTTSVVSESSPDNTGLPTEEYLEKNSQGIINRGNNDPDDFITPQIVPYQQVKFPVSIGTSDKVVDKSGLIWQEDLDDDGMNESFSVAVTVTNTGVEAVTLPIGNFPNALRSDIKLDLQVTLSAIGEKVTLTRDITEWHAPDIGPIKTSESTLTEGPGGSIIDTEITELSGYLVNGSGRGLLPKFTIASELATADSDTESPGQPGIGSDRSNYLVVTCREAGSSSPSGVFGVFVSTTGALSNPFPIAQHTCFGFAAAVAFDGANYLVVFQRYSNGDFGDLDIFATRVTPSGNILDSVDGFPISPGSESKISPTVAFDGTNYLVVYGKYILSATLWDIYATRVSPAGQLLDEFPISAASGDQLSPSVAFDGTNYMVVWEDTPTGSGPSLATDVIGARVSSAGTVLDPAGIAIATAAAYQGDAHIAYDGSNYFVAWANVDSFFLVPPVSGIYGRRLKTDGTLLDDTSDTTGIAINTTPLSKDDITVNFNGSNYFVVWRMGAFSNDPPAGVYAARITTTGELLDGPPNSTGLSVSGLPPDFSRYVHPTMLFNGTNSLLTWNNNIELSGSWKSLEALFIYPF